MIYKAQAPGSLMLAGEYAVLNGYPALVCAIDKKVYVTLKPREDRKLTILSDRLGYLEANIQDLNSIVHFKILFTLLHHYQSELTQGFDLEIRSDLPPIGLGSSGALITNLLIVFQKWLTGTLLSPDKFLMLAIHMIEQSFGKGSGADVAASFLGGTIYYHYQPLAFEKLSDTFPLSVIYSGTKKSTPKILEWMSVREKKYPALFESLYQSIGECTHFAYQAIQANHWTNLGEIFNIQQGLMESLGVNNMHLTSLINQLKEDEHILGAKISGSGLGDCVIGLGNFSQEKISSLKNGEWIPIKIVQEGALYE